MYGIVLQVHDPEDWPHGRTSVVPATRTELLERLSGWGIEVTRGIAGLELAKQGEVALGQGEDFKPIHLTKT